MTTIDEQDEILTIAPYTIREEDSVAIIGDLFIKKNIFYYIPLEIIQESSTIQPSTIGALTGGALGSLLGDMSGHFETPTVKEYFNAAIYQAEENRKMLYGLSPQERAKKTKWKDWGVIIPKDSVLELSGSNSGVLFWQTNKKKRYIFIIPRESPNHSKTVQVLQIHWNFKPDDSLMAARKLEYKYPRIKQFQIPDFGLEQGYITPLKFVDAFNKGQSLSQDLIDRLTNNEDYMYALSQYYDKFSKNPPDSAVYINFNLKLGNALNGRGKPHDAIKCFERALKYNPHSVEALVGKGDSYQILGNSKAAERELDIVIGINPESADAWFIKGYIYFNKGVSSIFGGRKNFEKALEYFNAAINTIPKNDVDKRNKALIFQGASLYELGDYSGAINSCQEALEIDRDVNEAWFYKGMSETKLKKYDDSRKSLQSFFSASKSYNILKQYQIDEAKEERGIRHR